MATIFFFSVHILLSSHICPECHFHFDMMDFFVQISNPKTKNNHITGGNNKLLESQEMQVTLGYINT